MIGREVLKDNLSKSIAEVIFTKTNGEKRTMYCTLMSEYLPQNVEMDEEFRPIPRQHSDETLAVWDIDKKGWRSFRLDSIEAITYIGVNRV